MKLPSLPYSGNYKTTSQTTFKGLNANPGAADGEIIAMKNLTGILYPILSAREPRSEYMRVPGGRWLWAEDFLVVALSDGLSIFDNDLNETTIRRMGTPTAFAQMLRKLIVFPQKIIVDLDTMTYSGMEATVNFSGVSFQNGTIFGESAEANTIYKSGANWGDFFKAGDAITISGATAHPENNKTPIIREIDGDYLRFYEYTFTLDPNWKFTPGTSGLAAGTYHFTAGADTRQFSLSEVLPYGGSLDWTGATLLKKVGGATTSISTSTGSGGTELTFQQTDIKPYTETGELTFEREVPDLDFICVNENRLWGCKGDSIYASKLGDPTNFNVFDGLSTDSWQSDVGDKGDFTACISYLGYPMFFKEDSVIKVYGDKPSNFQWTPSARFGVAEGSHRSLAVANETLFYLSPAGIVAYSGGIPTVISQPLGVQKKWSNASAGSDGLRYYVSMKDDNGNYGIFVYDTKNGMWHKEDNRQESFAYWHGSVLMMSPVGLVHDISGREGTLELPVLLQWEAEFADATEGSPMKKGVLRLMIRLEMLGLSEVNVHIQCDEETTWHTLRTITRPSGAEKQSYVIPIVVRRCDHWRLKLSGFGQVRVYSIAQTRYIGSEKQNW